MTKRQRQPKETPSLKQVVQAVAQLNRSDKEELLVILHAMLEADEDEPLGGEQTLKDHREHRGPKGGCGYYERKIINGCGSYLYLRYWSGGKHRSIYIGKV